MDNIIFAGDNVEYPHPYIESDNLTDKYINTLKGYLNIKSDIIIPGHGEPCDDKLVSENIKYLEELRLPA